LVVCVEERNDDEGGRSWGSVGMGIGKGYIRRSAFERKRKKERKAGEGGK